ncbi:MAG: CvpA family protein [Solibacillus sp.]
MAIDLILFGLVVFAGVRGIRKGFMFTFINTAELIMSLVLAFIATPFAKTIVQDKTTLYESLIPSLPMPDGVPKIISDITYQVTNSLIYTVIIYLIIFIVIRFVLMLLFTPLKRDYKRGVMGFIDGFFGLAFGLVKGAIYVFLLLALLIPAANILAPEMVKDILLALDNSYVAKTLYDNNYLMVVLQNFFETTS